MNRKMQRFALAAKCPGRGARGFARLEPAAVAYPDRSQIDEAYLRCLRILMKGNGYPMVASHDPTMIAAARHLAAEVGWDAGAIAGCMASAAVACCVGSPMETRFSHCSVSSRIGPRSSPSAISPGG